MDQWQNHEHVLNDTLLSPTQGNTHQTEEPGPSEEDGKVKPVADGLIPGFHLFTKKNGYALLMGLLTAFFCIYLADGILMMWDNWSGRILFGATVWTIPTLFRKKMDIEGLLTVSFLVYLAAIEIFVLTFGRVSTRHFFLMGNLSITMSDAIVFRMMIAMGLALLQSVVWTVPVFAKELKMNGKQKEEK